MPRVEDWIAGLDEVEDLDGAETLLTLKDGEVRRVTSEDLAGLAAASSHPDLLTHEDMGLATEDDLVLLDGRVGTLETGAATLDTRLDQAETALTGAASDIDALQAADAALDGRLDSAETGLTALAAADNALASADNALDTRLDAAEGSITTLDGRVDAVESDIDTLQTAAGSLDTRVDALEGAGSDHPDLAAHEAMGLASAADLAEVVTDVETLQTADTALDGRLDTAEGAITALQGADTALDGRLDTAEGSLTSLDTRLDTAESDIDALQAADVALDTRVDALEGAGGGGEHPDLAAHQTMGLATTDDVSEVDDRLTELVVTTQLDLRISDNEAIVDGHTSTLANHESRLDSAENDITTNATAVASLDTRVDAVETADHGAAIAALDTRVDAAEGALTALDTRVDAVEGSAADHETRIDALEAQTVPVLIGVALSDGSTAITTGTAKETIRAPFAFTLTGVRSNLNTASSSGVVTVDINEGGASVLHATNKLSIDANEKTSVTAATATSIADAAIADDAEITFDIDAAGTGAKGLKCWLIGTRAV